MEAMMLISMFGICSFEDFHDRHIHVIKLIAFGLIGVILNLITKKMTIPEMLLGMAMGIILYLIAALSKEKIGKGDAVLFCVIGIYLGFLKTVELLWLSSILAAIVGFLAIKTLKLEKNHELPFVPVVALTYVVMLLAEAIAGGVL